MLESICLTTVHRTVEKPNLLPEYCINSTTVNNFQGWGPRGLASTSRTARGQNFAALALASKTPGLGLGLDNAWPRF